MYYEDSSDPVVEDGLSWDAENKVLTLENYHSRNIGILLDDNIKLVLKGENVIEAEEEVAFFSRSIIEISGDGSLSATSASGTDSRLLVGAEIILNSGVISGKIASDILIINGGEWNNLNNDHTQPRSRELSVFIINDGVVNLKNNGVIYTTVFNQNGGKLHIETDNCGDPEWCSASIYSEYTVFNDGEAIIKGGMIAGLYISGEYRESKENLAGLLAPYGVVLPENGLLEVNGGDITIDASSSMVGALVIAAENGEMVKDGLRIADDLTIEPEFAKYTTFDMGGAIVGVLSDGKGEAAVSTDPATGMPIVEHIAKKVRIYSTEEENEEDINVPNTGAFKQDSGLRAEPIIFAMLAGISVAFITYKTLRKNNN